MSRIRNVTFHSVICGLTALRGQSPVSPCWPIKASSQGVVAKCEVVSQVLGDSDAR